MNQLVVSKSVTRTHSTVFGVPLVSAFATVVAGVPSLLAGVTETRRPDAGFAPVAHAWADGETIEILLDSEPDMTAGDFVRNVKLLIDLLRQVAAVAPNAATRTCARQAADSIHRGVVALSGSVSVT